MLKQIIDICRKHSHIVIAGAGKGGEKLWEILHQENIVISCFCDNNAMEYGEKFGIKVLLPQEAAEAYPDALYVIAIMKKREEVLDQLLQLGIMEKQITHFYLHRDNAYYKSIAEECYRAELEDRYRLTMGVSLDIDHPTKFTEKIQWLKLFDRSPVKTQLADKYAVRSYIQEKIGGKHLIPLLGVWNCFSEIDFESLPDKFMLKCNHGCGMNHIIRNVNISDLRYIEQDFNQWMRINWAYQSLELHYQNIEPRIIAEQYIQEIDGNLFDYKVHCFQGEPTYIQVIGDRDLAEHTGLQLVYDFQWNRQMWTFGDYPKYQRELERPSVLDDLYDLSKLLCRDFPYVRIDWYIISEKILFGEMTFTPASGYYPYNEDWGVVEDTLLGNMIELKRSE